MHLYAQLTVVLCLISCITCQNLLSISFVLEEDCSSDQFYNSATLRCESCGNNRTQSFTDKTRCMCNAGYKMDILDPRSVQCTLCPDQVTTDGYFCTTCSNVTDLLTDQCSCSDSTSSLVQYDLTGVASNSAVCSQCSESSIPTNTQRCVPCPECCFGATENIFGQLCFSPAQAVVIEAEEILITTIASDFINTANVQAAYGACQPNLFGNQTACHQLANMCVMEDYSEAKKPTNACGAFDTIRSSRTSITGRVDWKENLPWIKYITSSSALIDTGISRVFNFGTEQFDLKVAKFRTNGTYLGISDVTGGLLQLCKDTPAKMDAAYVFGTTYKSQCNFDANILWTDGGSANIFFEMYLEDKTTDPQNPTLYPIPVRVLNVGNNQNTDSAQWQLVRRFYLIDNIRNKVGTTVETVHYASDMSLSVELQLNSNPPGKIFPPLLTIEYSTVSESILTEENPTVVASFAVTYSISMENFEEGLTIGIPIFGTLAIIYSMIETSGWRRREGIQIFDFASLIQLILSLCSNIANVFFGAMVLYTFLILIFFKRQTVATSYAPTETQELLFIVFTSLAFGLKAVQILAMILWQSSIGMFMIDWEKPDNKSKAKVSIWRTYFIANEWNEIQTYRKTSPVLQLFAAVLFLEVVGFQELALMDPSSDLSRSSETYIPEYNSVLRFAVGSLTYIILGILQTMYFVFIHERFFQDPIREFVDLCSVANVSVFILSHRQFGYYIHGRSVHGKADTDMVEMSLMLKREEENLVSTRGLVAGSDNQTFDIQIPAKMRMQYDKIYEPLQLMKLQPAARGGITAGESLANESAKAYIIMRNFLSSFFDHSLRDLDYIVKDKLFLEKVMDLEFREPIDKAYVNNDESGCSFCNVTFYGHEAALLIFETLLFNMIDFGAQNFVVAAICTYVIGLFLTNIRQILGRYNLARKTLVDKRFLI